MPPVPPLPRWTAALTVPPLVHAEHPQRAAVADDLGEVSAHAGVLPHEAPGHADRGARPHGVARGAGEPAARLGPARGAEVVARLEMDAHDLASLAGRVVDHLDAIFGQAVGRTGQAGHVAVLEVAREHHLALGGWTLAGGGGRSVAASFAARAGVQLAAVGAAAAATARAAAATGLPPVPPVVPPLPPVLAAGAAGRAAAATGAAAGPAGRAAAATGPAGAAPTAGRTAAATGPAARFVVAAGAGAQNQGSQRQGRQEGPDRTAGGRVRVHRDCRCRRPRSSTRKKTNNRTTTREGQRKPVKSGIWRRRPYTELATHPVASVAGSAAEGRPSSSSCG